MSRNRLILFARFPEAGRVKTRLTPALDFEQAAVLYRGFLIDLVPRLLKIPAVKLIVAVAGGADDIRRMDQILDPVWGSDAWNTSSLVEQRGEDLGERIEHAFRSAFEAGSRKVVVLGADHPTIPRQSLVDAFNLLDDHAAVIGPSSDGGFWSLGLTRSAPGLFEGMTWSTPSVFQEMCARLDREGIEYARLPEWYDVDRPEDLLRLAREVEDSTEYPATRRVLEMLGMVSEPNERGASGRME